MTVEKYLQERARRLSLEAKPRDQCWVCRKPLATCLCSHLRPFEPVFEFVILIHTYEARRNIATGRLAHLSLKNSRLIEGTDFTHHPEVNAILGDPDTFPVVLYPHANATQLTPLSEVERRAVFPTSKKPVVFVIDGTWAQAKRMRRLSRNLHSIPHVCFTPPHPSQFLVRKQPHEGCFSTIESIHHFLSLMGGNQGIEPDSLLEVFHSMVAQQLSYQSKASSATARRGIRRRSA